MFDYRLKPYYLPSQTDSLVEISLDNYVESNYVFCNETFIPISKLITKSDILLRLDLSNTEKYPIKDSNESMDTFLNRTCNFANVSFSREYPSYLVSLENGIIYRGNEVVAALCLKNFNNDYNHFMSLPVDIITLSGVKLEWIISTRFLNLFSNEAIGRFIQYWAFRGVSSQVLNTNLATILHSIPTLNKDYIIDIDIYNEALDNVHKVSTKFERKFYVVDDLQFEELSGGPLEEHFATVLGHDEEITATIQSEDDSEYSSEDEILDEFFQDDESLTIN